MGITVRDLCEQSIGLLRGKRLILTAEELEKLNALDYSGLAELHAQDEAVVCAMHFERVRDRLQQMYPWVFARKQYQYGSELRGKLPDDFLAVLCVLQDDKPIEYDIQGGKLQPYSADTLIYTSKVDDVTQWPPIFCDVFVYSLAVEICPAVTGKPEYVQLLEQKAQELLHRAQQIGAIRAETRLTLQEELYNRAIGLSRGQRSIKTTSAGAVEQGVDNAGLVNDRMTAEYQACIRASSRVRDRLLGLYAWKFARSYRRLTTKTIVNNGWNGGYEVPYDCLKVLSVYSLDGAPIDFEEIDNMVCCNEDNPEIRYTAQITNPEKWSGIFADVYCYTLAQEIIIATTANPEMVQLLEAKAQNLIQEAHRLGEIRAEVKIPASDELYNRAIALVRGQRIASPSGNTAVQQGVDFTGDVNYREREAIAVCKRSMPEIRDKLLRLYAWKFARSTATVSREGKRSGWNYAYSRPVDCMKVLAVLSDDEPVEYEETDGVLLSDASGNMTVRYIKAITDMTEFDPVFKEVLCYELAEEISAALTWNAENISLLEHKKQQIIQNAYRTGVIQEETRISLKQKIYDRAIALARGVRTLKSTSSTATEQGIDNYGIPNDRTDAELKICRTSSESVRDRLLQLYPWMFARKTATLEAMSVKMSGWNNSYALPSDCLTALTVIVDDEPVDYEIINGSVYCNGAGAVLRYTSRVDRQDSWSGSFVDVYCYELAEEIISATTGNSEGIALLEKKKQAIIVDAYKVGAIKTETRIPAKYELFNRAIGLVKGLKTENPDMLDNRYEDELSTCRRSYESIRNRLLQSYAWVFARKTETPAQLSASVPGWRYTYMLPADCLRVIAVIGQDRRAGWNMERSCRNISDFSDMVELTEYETAGHELYANRDVVYVRYTARVEDSTKWEAVFTESFVILLAIEIALNVVGDKNIIAILEQRLARLIEDAKLSGAIREETKLPKQRESVRAGAVKRQYMDYSGIPTLPCTDYYGRRASICEGGTGELCHW